MHFLEIALTYYKLVALIFNACSIQFCTAKHKTKNKTQKG